MLAHRRCALSLFCIALLAAPAGAVAEDGDESQASSTNQYVGVGAGLYLDDGELVGSETRDIVDEDDESYFFEADNTLMGSIWYLRDWSENIRWGGGLRYYGSYEIVEVPEEPDPDEEPQPYELGQLTDFYVHAEYVIRFADSYGLALGAQVGPSLLFPDGDLQREIEELDEQNVDVYDGPRIGFNFAPVIGALWQFDDRLTLRGDFAVRSDTLYIFAIDEDVDGVAFQKSWDIDTLRYEFGLAMEVQL